MIEIVPEIPTPPCESVTFAVKLYVPDVALEEIVPEMLPLLLKDNPVGKDPELRAHAKGPTPPVWDSAVDG